MNILKRAGKKALRKSLGTAPFSLLARMSREKILLPVYHTVSDEDLPHIKHLFWYRNIGGFKKDLDTLLKHFEAVSLTELISHVNGNKPISKPSFLISFDDGYREVFDVIAPILKERSIPAVFFLNTDFIDNRKLFYRNKASLIREKLETFHEAEQLQEIASLLNIEKTNKQHIGQAVMGLKHHEQDLLDEVAVRIGINFQEFLQKNKPYLDSLQVKNLIDQDFVIASHGTDHAAFEHLSLEDQLQHIAKSFSFLKQNFNIPYNAFAFPFNEKGVSSEFYEQTHFSKLIDISFGTDGFQKGHCKNNLERQSMEEDRAGLKSIYSRLFREKIISTLR